MTAVKFKKGTYRLCACGCGEFFRATKYHGKLRQKYGDYPRFKTGHVNRLAEYKKLITGRPAVVGKWLKANQGKFICVCGCGEPIQLQYEYHSKGVPHYKHGHHPNSRQWSWVENQMRRKFKAAEKELIYAKFKYQCVQCRSDDDLEIDHVIPLSKGGRTEIKNAQLLCRDCHMDKTHTRDTVTRKTHKGGKFRGVKP